MTTLSWIDPETGETCTADLTGWQFVIVCEAGEIARMDFVSLALMTKIRTATAADPGRWTHSLLQLDGSQMMVEPPDHWMDVRIEKR